jgi:succinate dehydrogenase / fumarate reductase, iron-sulfur subunit
MNKQIIFNIFRYKKGQNNPGMFQNFEINVAENMTILDCLEHIRLNFDKTLIYRHSCHHSCCGTCAMIINGREKLACITPVFSLGTENVKLEPLKGLDKICDLAVDMKSFYDNIPDGLNYLRTSEGINKIKPEGVEAFTRFENCIECASCISACPVTHKKNNFIGPAGLAAVNNEIKKYLLKTGELLNIAKGDRGVKLCERAMECSRVCPTKVYPARHIKELMDMKI